MKTVKDKAFLVFLFSVFLFMGWGVSTIVVFAIELLSKLLRGTP